MPAAATRMPLRHLATPGPDRIDHAPRNRLRGNERQHRPAMTFVACAHAHVEARGLTVAAWMRMRTSPARGLGIRHALIFEKRPGGP